MLAGEPVDRHHLVPAVGLRPGVIGLPDEPVVELVGVSRDARGISACCLVTGIAFRSVPRFAEPAAPVAAGDGDGGRLAFVLDIDPCPFSASAVPVID